METQMEIEEIRRRLDDFRLQENDMWDTMKNGHGLTDILDAEEKYQRQTKFNRHYRDPKDGYSEDNKPSPVEKLRKEREDLSLARQEFRQDWGHVENRARDERKHGEPGAWSHLNREMSQLNGEVRGHEREIRSTPYSDAESQLLADTDPAAKPDTKIKDGDGSDDAPPPAPSQQPGSAPVRDVAAKWAAQQSQGKQHDHDELAVKEEHAPLRSTLAAAAIKPAAAKVDDGGKGDEGAPTNTPKEEPDVNPAAARALKTLEASKPSIELPAVRKFKV